MSAGPLGFDPRQAIEVSAEDVLFQVTVSKQGHITWKCPVGTDDVYFRGMMDKVKDAVLVQMIANAMGDRRIN